MTSPAVPSREECIAAFRQAYAEEWQRLWDDIRRRGIEAAAGAATDPGKARRRLEEIRDAARAGKAA